MGPSSSPELEQPEATPACHGLHIGAGRDNATSTLTQDSPSHGSPSKADVAVYCSIHTSGVVQREQSRLENLSPRP